MRDRRRSPGTRRSPSLPPAWLGNLIRLDQLGFERRDEALGHGVVQGGPGSSHRRGDAHLPQLLPRKRARCTGSLVGVMHQPGSGLPPPNGHPQGVHDEFGPKMRLHRPPDDPPGVDIEDEGQVQEAFLGGDICNVRYPDLVHLRGHGSSFYEVLARRVSYPDGWLPFSSAAHAAL